MKNGINYLCIENKIYAGDQEDQIERYCNFESKNNTVLYLTLKGKDPHKDSRGDLKSGVHFHNISYREHIIEWLELCLKEVPNLTSVREAINQYILLIKKLTHMLNREQNRELQDIMAKNLEEAAYISSNYENMITVFKENFRADVKRILYDNLNPRIYEITNGLATDKKYSQLWINFRKSVSPEFKFGIASFNGKGHINGNLFIGLLDEKASESLKNIPEEHRIDSKWRHTRPIKTKDGNEINLNHKFTLKKLASPKSDDYKELLKWTIDETLGFIKDYEKKLPAELSLDTEKIA